MICETCGAELSPGANFCENCGARVSLPAQSEPTAIAPAPLVTYGETPGRVLTWGILGAAFACSFFASFLGIVFGVIGLKKANAFIALNGPVSKQVKIAHILAKVGIIAGSILSVLFCLYVAFFVFMFVREMV